MPVQDFTEEQKRDLCETETKVKVGGVNMSYMGLVTRLAQHARMLRHIGSALTDVIYAFDEPTAGLHPHDVMRMNELLLQLRDIRATRCSPWSTTRRRWRLRTAWWSSAPAPE